MKLFVITTDTLFDGEAAALNSLFHAGMGVLHVRKPFADKEALQALLLQIDAAYHPRIVLHDHFELIQSFPLKGIHLNRRNPVRPLYAVPSVSRSCHSLACAATLANFHYVFLSPVFDSLSKQGYHRAFTDVALCSAKANGQINEKVIALGGISRETIPLAAGYGFGGVAVLGALWGNFPDDRSEQALIRRFLQLQLITSHL
jgi:thiamine-phosphate pyrophosphorylase